MWCAVRHGRHHQGDDDAARGAKQNGQHDNSGWREDAQPAVEQKRSAETGASDHIELAKMLRKGAAQHSAHEGTGVDQGKEVGRKGARHAMGLSIVGQEEAGAPEAEDDEEQPYNLEGVGWVLEGLEQDERPLLGSSRVNHGNGRLQEHVLLDAELGQMVVRAGPLQLREALGAVARSRTPGHF